VDAGAAGLAAVLAAGEPAAAPFAAGAPLGFGAVGVALPAIAAGLL
jgi:hypothetical protein